MDQLWRERWAKNLVLVHLPLHCELVKYMLKNVFRPEALRRRDNGWVEWSWCQQKWFFVGILGGLFASSLYNMLKSLLEEQIPVYLQKEMEADKVLIQTISSSSLLEVCLQLAKNPVYNPINRGGTNAVTFTNTFLLQMFNNLLNKW